MIPARTNAFKSYNIFLHREVGFASLGPRRFFAKCQNKCWKAFGHVGQNLHGDREEFVRQACKLCFCSLASTRMAQERA